MAPSKRGASRDSLEYPWFSTHGASTACPFGKLRIPSRVERTHGLRPAYSNGVNTLVAEARRMSPRLSRGTCVVCFLRHRSGILYVGASVDLEQRLDDHVSGQACRTTQLDPPLAILRVEVCSTFREARQREAQQKRWSRPKKEALIRGDFDRPRKPSESHVHIVGGDPGVSASCQTCRFPEDPVSGGTAT